MAYISILLSFFKNINIKTLLKYISIALILFSIYYIYNNYMNIKKSNIELNKTVAKQNEQYRRALEDIKNTEQENRIIENYYRSQINSIYVTNEEIKNTQNKDIKKISKLKKKIKKTHTKYNEEKPLKNLRSLFENLRRGEK